MAYEKTIQCQNCGVDVLARSARRKYCDPCSDELQRERVRLRDKNRPYETKTSRRVGYRKCGKCGYQKPAETYSFLVKSGSVICDDCRNGGGMFKLPKEWRGEYQREDTPARRLVQELAPSACYRCVKMKSCRAQVARPDYKLPCQVSW